MNSFFSFGNNNEAERAQWCKRKFSSIPENLKVLDVGAGELRNRQWVRGNYVSQDFCKYEGRGDGSGMQTGDWSTDSVEIISDITEIPCGDGSFDVIICTEVLEHVPDPVAALTEISRLLKSGGVLYLTAPFCSLTHMSPYHFASGFNKSFWIYHLGRLGYEILEITPRGDYYSWIGQELIRLPSLVDDKFRFVLPVCIYIFSLPLRIVLYATKALCCSKSELLCYGYMVEARKG